MKLAQVRRSGRRGFTLVELLVVIAIIGLLVSLISAAVWKSLVMSNRVKNHNEINQLALAVENFKQRFGIYLPSRFILCEAYSDYTTNDTRNPNYPFKSKLHADSVAFLQQIWPRIDFNFVNRPGLGPRWPGIDWNGDGKLTPGGFLLEGDQCLVFFLGGIPDNFSHSGANCTGFSINPQNPAYHTPSNAVGSEVIAPFFEFSSERLARLRPDQRITYILPTDANNPLIVSPFHYCYLDTYRGAPYAYFSSYKTRNGYNRFANALVVKGASSSLAASDCQSLLVWPYAESLSAPPRYLNPNTFQIISAGANGQFGRGSDLNPHAPLDARPAIWTPAIAGNTALTSVHSSEAKGMGDPSAGTDDQSNFYDALLGSTGN